MKKKIFLLLGICALLLVLISCSKEETTEPSGSDPTELGKGITLNKSVLKPEGLSTLYINTGDTLKIVASTILLKPPTYSWTSGDEKVLKMIQDTAGDSIAYAIALGDSGTTTTLKIYDSANKAEKTIDVNVVRFWADPDEYDYLGSLNGHHYYLSISRLTWVVAEGLCEEAGGYLVAISSEEENEFLHKARGKIEEIWIGLRTTKNASNNWVADKWANGEEVTYDNFKVGIDPGIFFEIYWYMTVDGSWDNWHERTYNWFLEME